MSKLLLKSDCLDIRPHDYFLTIIIIIIFKIIIFKFQNDHHEAHWPLQHEHFEQLLAQELLLSLLGSKPDHERPPAPGDVFYDYYCDDDLDFDDGKHDGDVDVDDDDENVGGDDDDDDDNLCGGIKLHAPLCLRRLNARLISLLS